DIVVRAIGASGSIVAAGNQGLGTPGTVTSKPFNLTPTTIDTTVAQLLAMTGTWSVANAGDQARLDLFNVELLRVACARSRSEMPDLLQTAADWLTGTLKANASQPVTFRRGA